MVGYQHTKKLMLFFDLVLEDAHFIVYEDEREVIATNVSTCG